MRHFLIALLISGVLANWINYQESPGYILTRRSGRGQGGSDTFARLDPTARADTSRSLSVHMQSGASFKSKPFNLGSGGPRSGFSQHSSGAVSSNGSPDNHVLRPVSNKQSSLSNLAERVQSLRSRLPPPDQRSEDGGLEGERRRATAMENIRKAMKRKGQSAVQQPLPRLPPSSG